MGATKGISKERLAKLMGIRDRSLAVLAKSGEWEQVSSMKALAAQIGPLNIMHRTPFQKLPAVNEQTRYLRSLLKNTPNLPYGLDIWHQNKKVLNLEWDDQGELIAPPTNPVIGKCFFRRPLWLPFDCEQA